MRYFKQGEPEPTIVYVELIAASFTMLVPAAIMAVIFVAVGIYCAVLIGGTLPWIAIAGGSAASAGRLVVIVAYRRQTETLRADRHVSGKWHFRLATTTLSFAASLALLGVTSFLSAEPIAEMLTTGLLFGFCAGAVARGYIRPKVCAASVTLAAVPTALAAASTGDNGHMILAGLFLAFLAGSLETIRHAYRLARQQIGLRNEMTMVARHDTLTGLANRFGLREAFDNLVQSDRDVPMVAVHCVDLDRFKPVNDRHGHPVGDAVLRELAVRITETVRDGDIVARLGGDEFIVVQGGIGRAEEAEMFARRLVRMIAAPYLIDGKRIEIGVSLGYATSPPHDASLDELIEAADASLYRVKRAGGGVGSGDVVANPTLPKVVGW